MTEKAPKEPIDYATPDTGSSKRQPQYLTVPGRTVVLTMVIGGVILALIALHYRKLEPLVPPSTSQPTSSAWQ